MHPGSLHVPDPAVQDDACKAARDLFLRVGDKWTLVVIGVLWDGPVRFSAIRRSVPGLSQRMLTLTLRELEHDGLVTRTVTPTSPPRVDYALTALGRSLGDRVRLLSDWAYENHVAIKSARAAYPERPKQAGLIRAAGT
jgi:DNA-binding HxlR family transcriptional regulator